MRGFSLLELSIVLVIIGLIAGGIVAGSSMIRAAEIRSVATDFERYQTAVFVFKDKYFGVPGDLKNATAFWGAVDGGDGLGVDCTDVVGTGTETCNGDGDSIVANTTSNNPELYEKWRAWQHLANADLISGNYTGVKGSGGTLDRHAEVGVNVPASKLSGGGYTFHTISDNAPIGASNIYYFEGSYGTIIAFGAETSTTESVAAVLLPEEAWNIDKKIDDGRPGLGRLTSREAETNCNTTAVGATAEYNLTVENIACSLVLKNM